MRPYFWIPYYYEEKRLTDEIISQVEAALGVKLPESYLEIMRVQNGGTLRYDHFLLPEGYNKKWLWIDEFRQIQPFRHKSIIDSPALIKSWEMPENLVLLAGDGHVWLALDYRQLNVQGEPGVVYIDNESDEEIRLAETFAEFLDGLVDGSPRDVVGIISNGAAPEGMAEQLNLILGINLVKTKFPGLVLIYYEDNHPPWSSGRKANDTLVRLERNHQLPYSYPMFPLHDWLFSYEVSDSALADDIFRKIVGQFDYEVIKIHTPLYR